MGQVGTSLSIGATSANMNQSDSANHCSNVIKDEKVIHLNLECGQGQTPEGLNPRSSIMQNYHTKVSLKPDSPADKGQFWAILCTFCYKHETWQNLSLEHKKCFWIWSHSQIWPYSIWQPFQYGYPKIRELTLEICAHLTIFLFFGSLVIDYSIILCDTSNESPNSAL